MHDVTPGIPIPSNCSTYLVDQNGTSLSCPPIPSASSSHSRQVHLENTIQMTEPVHPLVQQASGRGSSTTRKRHSSTTHCQVERRYREGLKAELDRLRRAIPTLSCASRHGSVARLSKVMVLASAIDYIRSIEDERAHLQKEIEGLKCHSRSKSKVK